MAKYFLSFLIAGSALAQTGFSVGSIDTSVQACTDFYGYACGNWVKKNPTPPEYSRWGRFAELEERNFASLKDILETAAAKSTNRTPVEQKIGDYYASCMAGQAIDAEGAAPLKPLLDRIAGVKNKFDVAPLVAELQRIGANVFFRSGAGPDYKNSKMNIAHVNEGGLGLPDRDYYLKTDARSEEIRKAYGAHIQKMFDLAGYSEAAAAAAAKQVMEIETALAKSTMDRVARRNPLNRYHMMDVETFAEMSPSFDWEAYGEAVKARVQRLNVSHPEFFKTFGNVFSSTPLDAIKNYLAWHTIHLAAPTLSTPFVNENFAFYGRTLTGAKELKPRWKRCVEVVDADLPEALGQKFVEAAYGPEAKRRMSEMIRNLTEALRKNIDTLDWMTEPTKKLALAKLTSIQNKIGHPENWLDYTPVEIKPDDFLGNSLRSNAFQRRRNLDKLGKPVDPTEWRMSPPTVNAYYSPLENNINFPAGILQPPFFDVKIDDPVNYGGIGAVIGHEITHGFDDSGRRFDAEGNLKDWWTPEDAKEYVNRAECIEQQYGGYTAVADVKVNGKLTLGENVADNGGLRIAYMALQDALEGKSRAKIDGFTPEQRFFLGWAQVWCQNITEEGARLRAQTDPHSPGRYRVNGTVSNMPEFWKAFGCKQGQPMVRGENACRVW